MFNMNTLSTTGVVIDTTEKYCVRAKLDTGPFCNYNCWFCYYQGDLDKQTPLEVIEERLNYIESCGIKQVDLSGGESSIRKDWFELLDLCKSKGMEISTLSNGYKFADYDFLVKSKEHGLEEILFSVHGFDEESHNKIVGNKKGFTNIIQSIENATQLGLKVRVNCVVTRENYKELDTKFVDLMLRLKPLQVNFLTLNFWGNITSLDFVAYDKVTDQIKKSIDRLKDDIEYLNVRYTPYCYMKGYEKYVCNVYQHIHDVYDWNMAVYNGNLSPEDYKENNLKCLYDAAAKDRVNSYVKPVECTRCKNYYICDGIEKQLRCEVYPISGEKIKNVNHYRKGFYENKCTDSNS